MSKKRQLKDGEECSNSSQKQKKSEIIIESQEELKCYLEQLFESKFNELKKDMVETIQNVFASGTYYRLPVNKREPSMYLKFTNEVKSPAFTHSQLEGKDGTHIKVALFDANNAKITDGSLSSMKIEIVPLLGEFGDNGNDNWTVDEFCRNIATGRPSVGPLLKGNRVLELKDGEVGLMDVSFGDNSRCTLKGMYRLGVRAHESTRKKISEGERIREHISNPFQVKDRRGKGYQKLHPPMLDSDIECLEKVGKERATKLQEKGISTVRDFLKHFFTNEAGLRKILDIKASDEAWRKMVDHARECGPDDNYLYSYEVADDVVFFFNSLYEFVGAKFIENYINSTEIDPSLEASVLNWKKAFYQNTGAIQCDHLMVNNYPVPVLPVISNVPYCDQVALSENNQNTISSSINLVASAGNQVLRKDLPGSSNIPSIGGNISFASLSNGGTSIAGLVPSQPECSDQRIIQQSQAIIQVERAASTLNFSYQHISDLGNILTQPNEKAPTPLTSAGELHLDYSHVNNWSENSQDLISGPIYSPDLEASLSYFLAEMPALADQPLVQPHLSDQANVQADEAKNQWTTLVAVVKWNVRLTRRRTNGNSVVREKNKEKVI